MIDVHTCILPQMKNGPKSKEEFLEMAIDEFLEERGASTVAPKLPPHGDMSGTWLARDAGAAGSSSLVPGDVGKEGLRILRQRNV